VWMARVYYVDVTVPADKKKRGKHKMHAVFDGGRVFRVKKLRELEDASEIYVDALFPQIYDEVLELLRKGVRVYLLKDTAKLKRLRMENNVRKSDENDAMLLVQILKETFRPLTIKELKLKMKMRPLIKEYEKIMRWRRKLTTLIKHGFDYNFKESIRLMNAAGMRISGKITSQIATLPIYGGVYKKTCKILGIKNSAELAILAIELPLHLPLIRLKGMLGLNPSRNKGRYNHRLRRHITRLATSLYKNVRKKVKFSNEIVEVSNRLPKKQAIVRLELLILKALRIAYLMTVKPLAGE